MERKRGDQVVFIAGKEYNRYDSAGKRQPLRAKVIEVDPSFIPLGSKVYVEGYGEAIAGDTGGAIKGNKIATRIFEIIFIAVV